MLKEERTVYGIVFPIYREENTGNVRKNAFILSS